MSLLVTAPAWASSTPVSAAPPLPWPSVEETRPDNGTQDTARLLEWLVSTELARSAEAQIRLLAGVDTLLPRLEPLAARRPRTHERGKVREFLRVATAYAPRVEQLARFPTLAALVREDVARGQRLVTPWLTGDSTEGVIASASVSASLVDESRHPPVTPSLPVHGEPGKR